MAAAETGPVERGGDGPKSRERSPFVDPPDVKLATNYRFTYGGRANTEPCGKCGCEFINVACPRIWPIGTVALTCSKCGSVVDYVDGLLIMTITEALREYRNDREWVIRHRIAFEPSTALDMEKLPSSYEVARELILMGVENGMSPEQISTEIGIPADYIRSVVQAAGAL